MSNKIVLASNNQGKVKEISAMLEGQSVSILTQGELSIPEIPETGLSFVENALLKARNAAEHAGLAAIADDSGICVDALNGAPGIYSARYAGVGASDETNLNKLLTELADVPSADRKACFVCVMVYVRHAQDPLPIIAEGIWHGEVTTQASGNNGFGYDPIFYLAEHQCTSAELDVDHKNQISHRAIALKKLIATIKDAGLT